MPDEFPSVCDRCGQPMRGSIMSMYNTDVICIACKKAERERPDYQDALEADEAAIRSGNTNYGGIGFPPSREPR